MKILTIEEFRKLSPEEKGKQYKKLSRKDKYLARITAPIVVQNDSKKEKIK